MRLRQRLTLACITCVSRIAQSGCRTTLYNYKKADFNAFRDVLSHIPWDIMRDSDDIPGAFGKICFLCNQPVCTYH